MSETEVSVYERLRRSLGELAEKLREGKSGERDVDPRILAERTRRIAREPLRLDRAPDSISCIVFERSGRRYAVQLESVDEVGPMSRITRVPGVPEYFLGVAARRGRIVAVVDLPMLFTPDARSTAEAQHLVMTSNAEVMCAVAADALHNIIEVNKRTIAKAMPTFPPLVQRHTLGVLEDRTVVLDLGSLLSDRSLRVEERG
ncbi:chemotaxis protein CheW [Polyangium aurulentum]|uniref:chemotaxis protein CheW n=1 Tax=Polyangium aurulentum TaxID=2567896 RepID=UPI0010AE7893|nr:chemotaxis protein CheW [Polyangium aurulentum]UQA56488.1 chemotaxis protein CheW [Polyangium aurulentum]